MKIRFYVVSKTAKISKAFWINSEKDFEKSLEKFSENIPKEFSKKIQQKIC